MKEIIIDKEKKYTAQEIDIDIDELLFNPYNARIFTISKKIIDEKKDELGLEENDDIGMEFLIGSDIQDKIYSGFTNKYQKDNDYSSLRKSIIKTKGLSSEKVIYITNKNIVLSGNTRLSIMKSLLENGEKELNQKVRALRIIEDIDTQEDIDLLENFFQYNLEEKVPYENFELWMKMHSMYKGGETMTFEELADKHNMDVDQVEKHIYTINEYYKTLNKLGNGSYIDLYKHLHMSSVMQYIAHDLNGKTPKYTKEIREAVTKMAITSILVDFNWNKIRKVSNAYLGIKNNSFSNVNKIEAIEQLTKEMIEKTSDTFDYTQKLIIEQEDISSSRERKEKLSGYDASSIISKMQTEADKVRDSLDKSSEQLTKTEIQNIGKSIRKLSKWNPDKSEKLSSIYADIVSITRE